ncbi:MAG TPA: DUF4231 domain-containing protein [Pyrinomonadaceae bacterium]|nr:DUF4231 domain-containing protein [Pyrinomonadaceae bacterium]
MCPKRGSTDEVKLIDIEALNKLIEVTPNLKPFQQEYLKNRWLNQILWWDQRAWEARTYYFWLRRIIVVGGILVPFLITATIGIRVDPWLRHTGAVISLVVAICAALEALYGWGAIWLAKRRAAELLKVEGWLFFHGGGPYKEELVAKRFSDFVTEVESKIAAEVGEYVAIAQKGQNPDGSQTQASNPATPTEKP